MTIQQLEYVLALDTHRHFVDAANHCFVTQPTLTMQLKKLEEEIGFTIFNRTKKPLQPTKGGEEFIAKAKRILKEVNELKSMVNKEKDILTGHFKIGIIPTLAPYLLPRFLPKFIAEYPQIRLEIHELQTDQIVERLKEGSLDIGLLVSSLSENEIREIPLFLEPFILFHPKQHSLYGKTRIGTDELRTEGLMILNEGHCFRDQTLEICNTSSVKSDTGFDYQSGSIESLMQLVRQGIGFTLVPELALLEKIEEDYTTRFKDPQPVREVSLAVHDGFTRDAVLESLRQSIMKSVPEKWRSQENYHRIKWR